MHDSMCYPHFTCPLQLGNKQLRLSVAVSQQGQSCWRKELREGQGTGEGKGLRHT